jgi:hypothetical protein
MVACKLKLKKVWGHEIHSSHLDNVVPNGGHSQLAELLTEEGEVHPVLRFRERLGRPHPEY